MDFHSKSIGNPIVNSRRDPFWAGWQALMELESRRMRRYGRVGASCATHEGRRVSTRALSNTWGHTEHAIAAKAPGNHSNTSQTTFWMANVQVSQIERTTYHATYCSVLTPPLLVRCSYFFISICNFFGGRLKDSEAQPVLTLIRGGVRTPDME